MSVALKKSAKALRARYGVAGGVQSAKTVQRRFGSRALRCQGGKMNEDHNERAHVVEAVNGKAVALCYDCMKAAHKPRRR